MIKKIYSKAQAKKLFEDNAMLIADKDCIAKKTAVKLLGQDAFNFAVSQSKQPAVNAFGIGGYTLPYMTEEAFYLGVTYRNIEIYKAAEQALENK